IRKPGFRGDRILPAQDRRARKRVSRTERSVAENPLLGAWNGPYGGVPPLDRVRVEHFLPALEVAIAEKLSDVERIAADPAPPTFENTLEAFERAGRTLARVEAVAGVWRTTMSTDDLQRIEGEMAARLAELDDRIRQNG